jgi:chemotaxis protein MotB
MKRLRPRVTPGGGREGRREGGWEILYTGFVLIMLVFFIMLASYAAPARERLARAARSFEASLGLLPGGRGVLPADRSSSGADPEGIISGQREVDRLFARLAPLLRRHGAERRASLVSTARGAVMRLADQALFSSGSAELGPKARRLMRDLARAVDNGPWALRIEGHTDDRPIHSERYPTNWELSTARAVNVLRVLQEEGGLAGERLAAAGFGEQRPLTANATERQRARNRRVEILFQPRPGAADPRSLQP